MGKVFPKTNTTSSPRSSASSALKFFCNVTSHRFVSARSLLFSLLIVTCSLLIANCKDPFTSDELEQAENQYNPQTGTQAVLIVIGDADARTLLPNTVGAGTFDLFFTLDFLKEGETIPESKTLDGNSTNSTIDVDLTLGEWTLNVYGYATADARTAANTTNALVTGTATFNVTPIASVTVSVTLTPNEEVWLSTGSGTLAYNITLPLGATGELFIYNDSDKTDLAVPAITLNGDANTGDVTLDSGVYYLEVWANNGGNVGYWQETAYIYYLATTAATVNITYFYNPAANISAFTFPGITVGTPVFNTTSPGVHTIDVIVEAGTVVTNLTPSIDFTGFYITPSPSDPQDFSGPVTYTVYVPGGGEEVYTVNVEVQPITPTVFVSVNSGAETGYENLAAALPGMNNNAGTYIVRITDDQDLALFTFTSNASLARDITLIADTGVGAVDIKLSSNGSMFTVERGVTLRLHDGITLIGRSAGGNGSENNNASLVQVNTGGTLYMEDGSKITGNRTSTSGGGVTVNSNSIADAVFIMNGGEISNNYSNTTGGGVLVNGSRTVFTINGGTISSNYANGTGGGGVYVSGSDNFTMISGTIINNEAGGMSADGGGIFIILSSFEMSGGLISENKATRRGGGVFVNSNDFTMTNGTIQGNTVGVSGGGVFITTSSVFTKTGGTIIGYDSDNSNINNNIVGTRNSDGTIASVVENGGHAAYHASTPIIKTRTLTAGPIDNMDSTIFGGPGGWDFIAITGTVSITGTPEVGQTLTASISGSNVPNTHISGYIYEWQRNGTAISGETGDTYTAAAGDVDQSITVVVSHALFTGSITSSAVEITEKPIGSFPITIPPDAFDIDIPVEIEIPGGLTVSRSGTNYPTQYELTVPNAHLYSTIRWYSGVDLTTYLPLYLTPSAVGQKTESYIINVAPGQAVNPSYNNSTGQKTLTVEVQKGGQWATMKVNFTVVN